MFSDVFVAIPALIAGIALLMLGKSIMRYVRLRRRWRTGVAVEGTCLKSYVKHGGTHDNRTTTQHHVYEYRTREGQPARFEEVGGPATVVDGDVRTLATGLVTLAALAFAGFLVWMFLTQFAT